MVLLNRPDGARNTLTWNLRLNDQHGIKRLRFGNVTASLVCAARLHPEAPAEIMCVSDRPFSLIIRCNGVSRKFAVKSGQTQLRF